MSTPPPPPSSPTGPPTEPEGTPVPAPEAAPAVSLDKAAPAPGPQDSVPADAAPAPGPQDAVPADGTPAPAGFAAPIPPANPWGPAANTWDTPANPWGTPDPSAPLPGGPAPGYAYGHPTPPAPGPALHYPGHPGYPGYPAYPNYPGHPTPGPQTNGLAVAGLVIGIVAIPMALLPFIFWLGAFIGLTGLGIAIGALVKTSSGAPRRTMSIVGVVLGVLSLGAATGGFFLTDQVVKTLIDTGDIGHSDNGWDEYEDDGWGADLGDDGSGESDGEALPSDPRPTPSAPTAGPGTTTPLAFGRTYTYPDGTEVRISAPRPFSTTNKYLRFDNAVELSFTITNRSDRTINTGAALPEVTTPSGEQARIVFDGKSPHRIPLVMPGRSVSGSAAFELPAGTTAITARISPEDTLPPALFGGTVH
ncbi:hypothetical protein AB0P15_04140 [Streptomyces sp. NPDC087917]|uniref:hypothetical protein n=1 Tax=Streptomyces sp. NPDC087917 TaxID=3155060 RepID=UPI00342B16B7